VKPTCGCTVVLTSDRTVPPGGIGEVAVRLDTAKLAGRTTKTVTVYTNDPAVPAAGVTLTGDVLTDVVAAPATLYLGRLRRGKPARFEVLVAAGRPGAAIGVTAVDHQSPFLTTKVEAAADGTGQKVVVEVSGELPLGRFDDQLRIAVTSVRTPEVVVPVFGSVEGDVVALPPQVTFGVTREGAEAARELFIRNRGARPVAVTRVVLERDVGTWDLATEREGVEYKLTLRLRPGLPPGKIETNVEIFTDHPDEPRLVVPLYAIVKRG